MQDYNYRDESCRHSMLRVVSDTFLELTPFREFGSKLISSVMEEFLFLQLKQNPVVILILLHAITAMSVQSTPWRM